MGRKPMTPQQRARMRKRILDAARTRFLEKGIGGLSMRAIAAKVGVSSMTLYLYYDGRQDIVRHIVAEGFEELRRRLLEAGEGGETPSVQTFCRVYLDFAMDESSYYTAMYGYLADACGDEPDDLVSEPCHAPLRMLTEALGGDEARAMALWSGLHGLAMLAIAGQVPGEHQTPDVGALLATALA